MTTSTITTKEDRHMGKVVVGATVLLDGCIAGPIESGFEHLFAWSDGGDHCSSRGLA